MRIPYILFTKRLMDLLVGVSAFIFFLPLFVLIAIMTKIDSKGPLFHREERLGMGGRRFRCLKFRTMVVDGDLLLADYLRSNADAAQEWEKFRKLRGHDPRVTRLGRFLRRFSIDEMPQVINIIKGDMSVVGPRPFLPRELPDIGSASKVILSVKPGMAGMWVASGRNGLPFRDRIRLEKHYVKNWSLWMDVKVLAKCFKNLFWGTGAY